MRNTKHPYIAPITQPHPLRPGYTQTLQGVRCWNCHNPIPDWSIAAGMEPIFYADGTIMGYTTRPAGDYLGTHCNRCSETVLLQAAELTV